MVNRINGEGLPRAYHQRRFHVFREGIEYTLRAIPFLLAEHRETFSEVLPPGWRLIRIPVAERLVDTLTSTYAQNVESPAAMRHRNAANACSPFRLARFPTSFLKPVWMIELKLESR